MDSWFLKQALTLTTLGGGLNVPPPLDYFFDIFATAPCLELLFHDFFPSSLAHILIPNLFKSDLPLRCQITINDHMSKKSAIIVCNTYGRHLGKTCIHYDLINENNCQFFYRSSILHETMW